MVSRREYDERVEAMRREIAALPPGTPARLKKPTSNLFRTRPESPSALDATGFSGVLEVTDGVADVLGMTTYEDLVAATLPSGQMPLVVPQLKTITLGGAVTGLGIESSSFRNGMPHESVIDMDVLTGGAEIMTVDRDHELFRCFPNSYGTLGYALRLRIELEPVQPYVHLEHRRFTDMDSCAAAIDEVCKDNYAFVDGTWFSGDECYLTLGTWESSAPRGTSDYTGRDIYYRSIQKRSHDWLTVHDYLWRWDPDWFWCSRAFGAQNPRIRRVWPRQWRRSDVYWKLIALENKYGVVGRIDRARGKAPREPVVQDIEVPVTRVAEFVDWLDNRTGIEPVWLCPIKQRDESASWPLYPLDPETLYVNVGFWSTVELPTGKTDGWHNKAIEDKVAELGGHKSLYSTAFYDEDTFHGIYGGETYDLVKKTYDPEGKLLDLYAKTVNRQ